LVGDAKPIRKPPYRTPYEFWRENFGKLISS
jgi:hypothetical protein